MRNRNAMQRQAGHKLRIHELGSLERDGKRESWGESGSRVEGSEGTASNIEAERVSSLSQRQVA